MIVTGAFVTHCTELALAENAARVAMLRPFLSHFLEGQTRNWDTKEMISVYTEHRPSASLLYSTNLSTLACGVPAVAALTQSFLAPAQAFPLALNVQVPLLRTASQAEPLSPPPSALLLKPWESQP
jgi:hypothetical protein